VALSRCRTFGGIVLSTPISVSGIKSDATVLNYSITARQNEPGPVKLLESKYLFQQELVYELFDFNLTRYRFDSLIGLVNENSKILDDALIRNLPEKRVQVDADVFQIATKFKLQLNALMEPGLLPEENQKLQIRIKQASIYFIDMLKKHLTVFLEQISIETDNKAVKKLLSESVEKFQKEVFIRISCLENSQNGFTTIQYIKVKSKADVDFRPSSRQKTEEYIDFAKNMVHPELYQTIKKWRNNLADEFDIPTYMILPHKSLLELVKRLPTDLADLKAIKGIGPAKIKQYGPEILSMIKDYIIDNNIGSMQTEIPVREKKKRKRSNHVSQAD
jgi:hypothetical protein